MDRNIKPQAEIVVDILASRVAELTKENAILLANLQIAQKEQESADNNREPYSNE